VVLALGIVADSRGAEKVRRDDQYLDDFFGGKQSENGDLEGEIVGEVLDKLENKFGVTMCYEDYRKPGEVRDPEAMPLKASVWSMPMTADVGGMDLVEALNALSKTTGRFTWQREGRIINIIDNRCREVPGYALDQRRAKVSFEGYWSDFALFFHRVIGEHQSRRRWYHRGFWEKEGTGPLISLQMDNPTVRSFFNRACDLGRCRWTSVYFSGSRTYSVRVHIDFADPWYTVGHAASAGSERARRCSVEWPEKRPLAGAPVPGQQQSWRSYALVAAAVAVGSLLGFCLGAFLRRRPRRTRPPQSR